MDRPSEPAHLCLCGRNFTSPAALNYHRRSCKDSKKRLSSALSAAKELWVSRKKRKIEPIQEPVAGDADEVSKSGDYSKHDVCDEQINVGFDTGRTTTSGHPPYSSRTASYPGLPPTGGRCE